MGYRHTVRKSSRAAEEPALSTAKGRVAIQQVRCAARWIASGAELVLSGSRRAPWQ
jgi:hypothetical protein